MGDGLQSGFDVTSALSGLIVAVAGALSVLLLGVTIDYLRTQKRSATRLARFGLLTTPPDLRVGMGRSAGPAVLRRLGMRLARRASQDRLQQVRTMLLRAGLTEKLGVEEYLGVRALAVLVGLLAGGVLVILLDLLVRGVLAGFIAPGLVVAGVLGYLVPSLVMTRLTRRRRDRIERALPNALDMLVVTLEAGIAFDSAVGFLCERADNPFIEELRRYMADLALGRSRREALDAMADRTGAAGVRQFATAVIQADELGTGMARALRAHSRALRRIRRVQAETIARQAPIKLLFPLVLCIMPALFVVIIGPAVLQAMSVLGGRVQ